MMLYGLIDVCLCEAHPSEQVLVDLGLASPQSSGLQCFNSSIVWSLIRPPALNQTVSALMLIILRRMERLKNLSTCYVKWVEIDFPSLYPGSGCCTVRSNDRLFGTWVNFVNSRIHLASPCWESDKEYISWVYRETDFILKIRIITQSE